MPKTIRNVYDEAVSFDKILMAHKKARRGKREKKEVIHSHENKITFKLR